MKTQQQEEVKKALEGVHDTTTMIKKFVKLLEKHETDGIDDYLIAFKGSYSDYHYYDKIKESIVTEIEMLGMDSEHAADILSV